MLGRLMGLVAALVCAATVATAAPEVRIAKQFGLLYIPILVMERQHLVEKHAAALGVADLKADYVQLGTGAAMNDALLSGSIDFVSTGAPSLLILWDRTRGGVKGAAALNATAQYLLTTNPAVKTLADFTDKDRIAVTSVKVSTQAVFLQMGAAKLWGRESYGRLDPLTVTRSHPDAITAFLSHTPELSSYFAASPYQELALSDPAVRKIATSYDLTGIDFLTPTLLITSDKFVRANPEAAEAVVAAAVEAVDIIKADRRAAAALYLEASRDKVSIDDVVAILDSPETRLTTVPNGMGRIADFLQSVGVIKSKPKAIGDLFLPQPGLASGN